MKKIRGFTKIRIPEGETYQVGQDLIAFPIGNEPGPITKVISGSMRLKNLVLEHGEIVLEHGVIVTLKPTEVKHEQSGNDPVNDEGIIGADEQPRKPRRSRKAGPSGD